ncbi:hypothetical protein MJO29_004318 [Puccinia striiformis f. sp. tritici]|nr:hypothetical protein MJO29_004318 [Puccinia striiformis f. sp. tritici]
MHMHSTGRRRRDSTKHICYAHASSLQAMFVSTYRAKPLIDRSIDRTRERFINSSSKPRNLHVNICMQRSRGSWKPRIWSNSSNGHPNGLPPCPFSPSRSATPSMWQWAS